MSDSNMPNDVFEGEIHVASKIIDYLSSGLYQSPAACLKELINNSYDADATRVEVYVKPDADRIIIEDNGEGMNREEFVKHFSRISESHKREVSDHTSSGRPKIGKIGIGFIAANEICDVMEIVSTKKGSTELLHVSINFSLMRKDIDLRKRDGDDIAKADYHGTVSLTDSSSHFTQVFLKNVRGEAKSILSVAGSSEFSSGEKSLYGLKPESEFKKLKDVALRTWSEFDSYSKNRLEVALNIPVRYHDHWLPDNLREQVKDIEDDVASLHFTLYFDGSEIRKPIVLNTHNLAIIERFNFVGRHVSARGYFYAQHSSIRPEELHGLLIRIRNAAVGNYDSSFLGFALTHGTLFQNWISAEIEADDRLEEALNIDRRTLRISHPAYIELQQALHFRLEDVIKRIRSEIYTVGSDERNIERAENIKKQILKISNQEMATYSAIAAERLNEAWADLSLDRSGQKKLLKKYTVDTLYSMIIDTARETLTPQQFAEFLDNLTERLLK